MTRKHLLKDLTFVEFRERMHERPVILLPFGSQEEQGPGCPMGDWMLTEALAARVAERADAIAAPTGPFGYADYFRAIPGGVQLRADTFVALFRDICDNVLDHGVDRLVVFNGHSGNYPLIDRATRELKRERGVVVPCLNVWRLITPALWEELHPGLGVKAFGHGGDPLTSVYGYLFPELMRDDLITAPEPRPAFLGLPTVGLNAVRFRGVDVNVPLDITERCTDGVAGGDPRNASAEVGERIVDYIVDFTAAFLCHFRDIGSPAPTPQKEDRS